jgi:hypothetical protein
MPGKGLVAINFITIKTQALTDREVKKKQQRQRASHSCRKASIGSSRAALRAGK